MDQDLTSINAYRSIENSAEKHNRILKNHGRRQAQQCSDVWCDFPRVGVLGPQKKEGPEPAIACFTLLRPAPGRHFKTLP
jgi:hypothetical protein